MIRTEHLTKYYDRLLALRDLGLDIPWGQIYGFLGPNGAGKTTTIKLLCGLLRPTQGKVLLGGIDVARDPVEAKRLVGYIPDSPYLYEKLTAAEFLSFVGHLYGMSEQTIRSKSDTMVELLGIAAWRNRLIEDFSHGMRQRLVFASAFLHDPRILIVDEPMVGLDPQSARLVKDLFRKMARDGGTVFLSTHTLSLAEEICDRIGIIHKGQLLQEGSLGELRGQVRAGGALEDIFLELTRDGEPHVHPPILE